MGNFIVTRTQSNIVFYTSDKSAYFINAGIAYQIVYIDLGKNGYRFASLRKLIKLIESGRIQGINDLAANMKPDVTWQHTQRKPWAESTVPV